MANKAFVSEINRYSVFDDPPGVSGGIHGAAIISTIPAALELMELITPDVSIGFIYLDIAVQVFRIFCVHGSGGRGNVLHWPSAF